MKTHAIDKDSELYPQLLRRTAMPPKTLYARGNLDILAEQGMVAIARSRATANGAEVARRITEYCIGHDATIVYGLSMGIDAAVHSACMEYDGKSIIVIDQGLDSIKPTAQYNPANQIIESGGLCVSGSPHNTSPGNALFMQRNRIQVGLSKCSIVIESDIISETMNHAEYCTQERHPLFVVTPPPGNKFKMFCEGNLKMIDDMKATPLQGRDDYQMIERCLLF